MQGEVGDMGDGRVRELAALERDRAAEERDRDAERRDVLAARRDNEEALIGRELEALSPGGAALARRLGRQRARAAVERAAAERDRQLALRDRRAAALDRAAAARELDRAARELALAAVDELTMAKRRGPGLEALEREIERSARTGDPLSVAFVDVDGLKAVNDTNGHAAGDRVLMDVADALRSELRGYDLVVRLGGDEFLCALPGADTDFIRERFAGIVTRLVRSSPTASFSVGFAELGPGETAEQLMQRADRALLAGRSSNGAGS